MKTKYLTYLSCFTVLIFAMVLTVISPLIMEIARSFELDIGGVGIIFTYTFIGLTLFVPVGGYIADRIGKKKVLNIAVAGISLALTAFFTASDFLTLCIASIFIGGFGGIIESMASAFLHDINPEKPEYYVNMVQIFFGIGAVIGPLAVGQAILSGFTWRNCYAVLTLVMAVVALIFIFSFYDEQRTKANIGIKKIVKPNIKPMELIKNKYFILLCLSMFFYTGSEVGAWGWMCTYLETGFMFTADKSTLAVSLFWIALTVGRVLCGMLTLKFKPVKIVIMLAFSSAIFTLLSAFVRSDFGIYFAVIAMGFAFSSQYPLIVSYAGNLFKSSTGTVFSLMVACSGVGNMLVPYLMGLTGEAVGMAASMIIPAVLFSFTGFIFIYLNKTKNAV